MIYVHWKLAIFPFLSVNFMIPDICVFACADLSPKIVKITVYIIRYNVFGAFAKSRNFSSAFFWVWNFRWFIRPRLLSCTRLSEDGKFTCRAFGKASPSWTHSIRYFFVSSILVGLQLCRPKPSKSNSVAQLTASTQTIELWLPSGYYSTNNPFLMLYTRVEY